jgi:DNA modification methylase
MSRSITTAEGPWLTLFPPGWSYRRERTTRDGDRSLPRRQILVGDALARLRDLPTASVDCCITSPPYYLLRNYGIPGQLGLEDNVEAWVANLLGVLTEVGRVLKPSGSLWLNLGDSYSRAEHYGSPPKSLMLAPERLVLALVESGWVLRNKVIWAKPNPMPHSVVDRLNTTYEPLYFLVRSPRYHFALDEIREPHSSARSPSRVRPGKYNTADRTWAGPLAGKNDGLLRAQAEGRSGHPLGRNPGDVWVVATGGYGGAHFATFPERLITRPLLASCPERICDACGTPWKRAQVTSDSGQSGLADLQPACSCQATWAPGIVLDPFFGAGTVGVAAEALHRDWVGIELKPEYAELARQRIEQARSKRDRAP